MVSQLVSQQPSFPKSDVRFDSTTIFNILNSPVDPALLVLELKYVNYNAWICTSHIQGLTKR